jgi:hypothetical protein
VHLVVVLRPGLEVGRPLARVGIAHEGLHLRTGERANCERWKMGWLVWAVSEDSEIRWAPNCQFYWRGTLFVEGCAEGPKMERGGGVEERGRQGVAYNVVFI